MQARIAARSCQWRLVGLPHKRWHDPDTGEQGRDHPGPQPGATGAPQHRQGCRSLQASDVSPLSAVLGPASAAQPLQINLPISAGRVETSLPHATICPALPLNGRPGAWGRMAEEWWRTVHARSLFEEAKTEATLTSCQDE